MVCRKDVVRDEARPGPDVQEPWSCTKEVVDCSKQQGAIDILRREVMWFLLVAPL